MVASRIYLIDVQCTLYISNEYLPRYQYIGKNFLVFVKKNIYIVSLRLINVLKKRVFFSRLESLESQTRGFEVSRSCFAIMRTEKRE